MAGLRAPASCQNPEHRFRSHADSSNYWMRKGGHVTCNTRLDSSDSEHRSPLRHTHPLVRVVSYLAEPGKVSLSTCY